MGSEIENGSGHDETQSVESQALVLADNLEQALLDASSSFDEIVGLCERIGAAERVLRQNVTRERLRGQVALTEETFRKAQKLAEYRLKGYRIVGSAWRDAEQDGRRPKGGGRPRKDVAPEDRFPTAAELGVDARRLNEYAMISEVPDEDFQRYVSEANQRRVEVTLSGLMKIAKAKRQAERDVRLATEAAAAEDELGQDDRIMSEIDVDRFAGQFKALYADPPWHYDDDRARGAAEDHYPTIGIDELCEAYGYRIKELAHPDGAHLWVWTTWPKLRDGFPQRFLEACGFEWKSEIVWDKQHHGTGRWIFKQTEVLILGVRGNLQRMRQDLIDLVSVAKGRHSVKPREFCEVVESFSPGPYIELFARGITDPRNGWWYHGWEAKP